MTCCTTLLARKWGEPIAAGASNEYEVDLSWALARRWESREWALLDTIRLSNGFDAVCEQAGRSGQRQPPWPSTIGALVADGSVRWRMAAASGSSLESSVSGFVWDPPAGISVSGGFDAAARSVRLLTVGADVPAGEHNVLVTATCSNGSVRIQPCTLCVVRP